MYLMKIRMIGTNQLLMHSEETLNPFSETLAQMKAITSKGKKKTDEDIRLLARLEYQASMYHDEDIGPYLPGVNIESCLVAAARVTKEGKDVERGLTCIDEKVPLIYDGPRTVEELWADTNNRDWRGVKVGQARVMRCRAKFPVWSVEPVLRYDPEILRNKEVLLAIAQRAGKWVGIGDFRRRYGRFTVELVWHEAEEVAA